MFNEHKLIGKEIIVNYDKASVLKILCGLKVSVHNKTQNKITYISGAKIFSISNPNLRIVNLNHVSY
jgi:hypothetical protein